VSTRFVHLLPARAAARPALALTVAAAGVVVGSVAFVRAHAVGHLHREADAPDAPVALVLGAEVYPDGTPSAFLARRLDLARRLLEAGRASVLLLSGDGAAPEYDEPEAMRAYLAAAGVPAGRMVLDRFGLDTYDSCFRAARVYGARRLLVVTQNYHLPRAVGTARALGLDAEGVGDPTVRGISSAWLRGLLRDQVACVKTVLDLVTRRRPILDAVDATTLEALGG
jgi:vancomycin permeability regulator SanA